MASKISQGRQWKDCNSEFLGSKSISSGAKEVHQTCDIMVMYRTCTKNKTLSHSIIARAKRKWVGWCGPSKLNCSFCYTFHSAPAWPKWTNSLANIVLHKLYEAEATYSIPHCVLGVNRDLHVFYLEHNGVSERHSAIHRKQCVLATNTKPTLNQRGRLMSQPQTQCKL